MSSCESNQELMQIDSQKSFVSEVERSGLNSSSQSWQKSYSPVQLISGKSVLVCNAPKCSYKTDKNSNFKRHFETMHCPLSHPKACCNLRFLTKGEFRYHTKTVHCQGHRCTSCKKLFNRRALLDRHMSIHTGNKPFHCPECDYASANKANVRRHLSVHKVRENGDTENSAISANGKGSNCNLPLLPAVSKRHESPELTLSSSSTSVVICLEESANLCHKSGETGLQDWTSNEEDLCMKEKTTKQVISHSIEHLLSQPYKINSDQTVIQHESSDKSSFEYKSGAESIKNEPSPYVSTSSHSINPNWSHTSALFSWTHFPEVHFSTQQGFPQVSGHHIQVPILNHPTSAPMMTPPGINDERQKQSLYECPFLPGTGTPRQSHLDLSLGLNRNEDILYSCLQNNCSSALAPHQESRTFRNNFLRFKVEGKEDTEHQISLQNDSARDCVIDYCPNQMGTKGARMEDMKKCTSESNHTSINVESHTSLYTGKSEFMKEKKVVDLMNEQSPPPPALPQKVLCKKRTSPLPFLNKCQFNGEYIHKKLRAVGKTENGCHN